MAKTLLVLDLDNTLVDTAGLLQDLDLLPRNKDLYENPIEQVIEAYIQADTDLLEAKPINHVLQYAKTLEALGADIVVITSRLSIPIDITLQQVTKVLGDGRKVFVSDKKWATVNSIVSVHKYNKVIIIDDKFDGYSGLKVQNLTYLHPDEILHM